MSDGAIGYRLRQLFLVPEQISTRAGWQGKGIGLPQGEMFNDNLNSDGGKNLSVDEAVKERVKHGLADETSRRGRERAFKVIRGNMRRMVERYPNLSTAVRKVKEYSISHLDELVDQAVASLQAKGFKVYIAKTGEEAVNYVTSVITGGTLVKSKTNVGKEIGLVEALQQRGVKVIETDLGDRIVQLDNSKATHPMVPAIHVPIDRIAEIFSRESGEALPSVHEDLVAAARKGLREHLLAAEFGLSGANSIAADTGSIFVMENEGNIRAVTSLPPVHVIVAGIDKIVPTLADAMTVVRGASVFGVGQDVGTYASIISGPSRSFDIEGEEIIGVHGPREVHIVLIDNGRRQAIDDGFGESLYCTNCGSCLNFCPIYGQIGDQFGYKYIGGRGVTFTAYHGSLEKAQKAGLSLCLNCKTCTSVCTSQIDTPGMIVRLRARAVKERGLPFLKRYAFHKVLRPKGVLRRLIKLGSTFQGLGCAPVPQRHGMKLRFPVGPFPNRLLPLLPSKSLYEEFPAVVPVPGARKRVAFFAGCMAGNVYTHLGRATINVLVANGVQVHLPPEQQCCGTPAHVNGDADTARELAMNNIDLFLRQDVDAIVTSCASCGCALKHEYPRLFADQPLAVREKVAAFAAKIKDISEFLVEIGVVRPTGEFRGRVTYHDPCHLVRGQGISAQPRELLKAVPGLEFVEMEEADTCCGCGGSFSLFYYELSRRLNDKKLDFLAASGATTLATGCPACIMHFADGLVQRGMSQSVLHPVEILERAYGVARA